MSAARNNRPNVINVSNIVYYVQCLTRFILFLNTFIKNFLLSQKQIHIRRLSLQKTKMEQLQEEMWLDL